MDTNANDLRCIWKAWSGRTALIVPGQTRAQAKMNALSRGLDPDVVIRAGGNASAYSAKDAATLREWGW